MQIQRCPECGMRLKTNYCDICMRRVPFHGARVKTTKEPWDSSSTHREEEGHECVSFDAPKKKAAKLPKIAVARPKRSRTSVNAHKAKIVAIILAAMSVASFLIGVFESVLEEEIEPEYNSDAYVTEDVPQITPTELYNADGIRVTADSAGLYYDDYTIAFTIYNESNRDVTVNTQQLSVNGFMLTCGFAAEVEAGETCQEFLQLYSYDLEESGITDVGSVAFYLNLYDSNDYSDIATTELITLKTDIPDDAVQPVTVSGWELYNDGTVNILITGIELSTFGDCNLNVYVENVSDRTVSVSAPSILINAQQVSGMLWNTLRPGTRVIDSVYIYDLEDMDITEVEQIQEITLELHVEYMEDWYVEETVTEAITFDLETLRPYMN